jgi:hypothetical protein
VRFPVLHEDAGAAATRAVTKAREKASASRHAADEVRKELTALTAMPQVGKAIAELEERISTFMRGLDEATPEQRVEFNRWLCARRPAIRFLLDVATRQVGLQIGDNPIDWRPLAPGARRLALQEGMADPATVLELPDGGVHVAEGEPVLTDQLTPEEQALLADEALWTLDQ